MYNFLTKNGQLIAFSLGVLISGAFLISVISGLSYFSVLPKEEQAGTSIFDIGLSGAIALAIIAAVAMVAFGLFQIFSDFKGSMKGIIGFAILLAIFFGAYATASGEATPYIQGAIDKFQDSGNGTISAGNLKFISGGIVTTVALVGIATVAFLGAEIRNLFK